MESVSKSTGVYMGATRKKHFVQLIAVQLFEKVLLKYMVRLCSFEGEIFCMLPMIFVMIRYGHIADISIY